MNDIRNSNQFNSTLNNPNFVSDSMSNPTTQGYMSYPSNPPLQIIQ